MNERNVEGNEMEKETVRNACDSCDEKGLQCPLAIILAMYPPRSSPTQPPQSEVRGDVNPTQMALTRYEEIGGTDDIPF